MTARERSWAVAVAASALSLLLAAGLLCLSAGAHDFWIEPSTFHPRSGTVVAVGLRVGQAYVGDPVPRQSGAIEQFFIRQTGKDQPVEGSDNIDPAGFFRAEGGTTAVIGYRSSGSNIELPADRFRDYLRQYGLDAIIAERARRGEQAKPGRERFFRYAKSLLTGQRSSTAATQPLGFAYEIVPSRDPTRSAGPLRGQILYDGKPLTGALVEAFWRDDPSVRLSAHSDTQGAFTVALPRPGVWLIKSVHMVRAGFFASSDWDSLWASLTFEAPEPEPRPKP